ncbi:hypothetical protein FN846DRAFT_902248 [Sphaerosporella brunnea]|uniref:Uncharacterized protein n=1 Tax=Sphaerosporella brunnea TaxID=1250544 RepID=A0A5J5FAH6_9PEZI|nr:hypothetical protein FN846DRAFT_902248 [Sphaerosporella brunnea]
MGDYFQQSHLDAEGFLRLGGSNRLALYDCMITDSTKGLKLNCLPGDIRQRGESQYNGARQAREETPPPDSLRLGTISAAWRLFIWKRHRLSTSLAAVDKV